MFIIIFSLILSFNFYVSLQGTHENATIIKTIEPLKKSTIIANKIAQLYQEEKYNEVIELYKKHEKSFAIGTSSPKIDPEKHAAKIKIIDTLNNIALKGNSEAQHILSCRLFNRCIIPKTGLAPFDEQKNLKDQYISCTFELFDFLLSLSHNKIPITTSANSKKKIVKEINESCSSISYILQACRYLQAETPASKNFITNIIAKKECDNWCVKEICQFLINYADSALSINDVDVTKKFINNIRSQKNASEILLKIAQEPIYDSVIDKLHKTRLEENDPALSDLNLIIAELYFYDKNLPKAHEFYTKNSVENLINNTINPNAFQHAFESCLANIHYAQQDINYLSRLAKNKLNDQLQTIKQYNKNVSYGVAALTNMLVKTTTISSKKISSFIENGLDHLAYAQSKLNVSTKTTNPYFAQKIALLNKELNRELNMALSKAYADDNDPHSSLIYLLFAMKYHNTQQNQGIINIIEHAQQQSCDFYNKNIALINTMLQFINKQPHAYDISTELSKLSEFASSDLFEQLVPYCEQIYKANKKNKHAIILPLIALYYKHKNLYAIAHHYLEQCQQPLPKKLLPLKMYIYTALNKPLPQQELLILIKQFIKNKASIIKEYTTIAAAAWLLKDFFRDPAYYEIALKFIAKFESIPVLPSKIIALMSHVEGQLVESKNSFIDTWQTTLAKSAFCNKFSDASFYNAGINYIIGHHLLSQTDLNYQKMIEHFRAVLQDKNVPEKAVNDTKKILSTLYYKLAQATTYDKEVFLHLIDTALSFDDIPEIRYEKAKHILYEYEDNQNLVADALRLLESNIQIEDDGIKDEVKDESLCLLAHYYFDFCFYPKKENDNKLRVPRDIDKAIAYLQQSKSFVALEMLALIYAGGSVTTDHLFEKYTDLTKSIEYTKNLIENNHNKFQNMSLLKDLYIAIDDYEKAYETTAHLLHSNDEQLTLNLKGNFICLQLSLALSYLTKNGDYSNALINLRDYVLLSDQLNNLVSINQIPCIIEHVSTIVKNNNIRTESAIAFCCLVAASDSIEMSDNNYHTDLFNYILSAAKESNSDAQLMVLPYWMALNKKNSVSIVNEKYREYLEYAHTGLFSSNLPPAKPKVIKPLITSLFALTKLGFVLPYYILCDYYKNDQEKFEMVLVAFNQASAQFHELRDTRGLIRKICSSSFDTFNAYATRFAKDPIKASAIDSFATFTLASMLQFSNDISQLEQALIYLAILYITPPQAFNTKKAQGIVTTLLGHTYYHKSLLEKSAKDPFLYSLTQGAQYGWLPACYDLAKEYIEQYKNKAVTINMNDFFPLIMRDIAQKKETSNFEHITIAEKIITIKEEIDKKSKSTATSFNEIHTLVHTNDEKNDKQLYIELMKLQGPKQQNIQQSHNLLLRATKQSRPSPRACIILALEYLAGTIVKKNYQASQDYLIKALQCGLYGQQDPNKPKKFHDIPFLERLCTYTLTLISFYRNNSLSGNNKILILETLQIIHLSIMATGLEEPFCRYFQEKYPIDLTKSPEWIIKVKGSL